MFMASIESIGDTPSKVPDGGMGAEYHEAYTGAHNIGIATATFYPRWYPGEPVTIDDTDKIRGDLALQTIHNALNNGNQIAIVDGGSSSYFIAAARELGADVEPQLGEGMSDSRRQAFRSIAERDGVQVICWTEPEKISMVQQDCMELGARPILDDSADIVVPSRDENAFSSYPYYQAEFEIESNKVWNDILRRHGLLSEGAEDLDAWVGTRFFKNEPEIVNIFLSKYRFKTPIQSRIDQYSPELWPNAIFLPLMVALKKGYKIVGQNVPYEHPQEQKQNETDSPEFVDKRAKQQAVILTTTVLFARYLEALEDGLEEFARMQKF